MTESIAGARFFCGEEVPGVEIVVFCECRRYLRDIATQNVMPNAEYKIFASFPVNFINALAAGFFGPDGV